MDLVSRFITLTRNLFQQKTSKSWLKVDSDVSPPCHQVLSQLLSNHPLKLAPALLGLDVYFWHPLLSFNCFQHLGQVRLLNLGTLLGKDWSTLCNAMRQIEVSSSKTEKQLAFWDYNCFAHFTSVILLHSVRFYNDRDISDSLKFLKLFSNLAWNILIFSADLSLKILNFFSNWASIILTKKTVKDFLFIQDIFLTV